MRYYCFLISYHHFSLFVVLWFIRTALGQDIGQIVDGPCSRFNINNQIPFFKKLVSVYHSQSFQISKFPFS